MKVKCIAIKLEEDQLAILGRYAKSGNHFNITVGNEYVVFGLTFELEGPSSGCFVEILSDYEHLISVPIILFETIDPRISKYWEIKQYPDGGITMWPPSMYQEFYHDDLSEDVPEVMEDFTKVKERILDEF